MGRRRNHTKKQSKMQKVFLTERTKAILNGTAQQGSLALKNHGTGVAPEQS